MLETTSYITSCTEDEEGNLVLEFPDGLLELVGWKEGDTLDIQALSDSIILRRVRAESEGIRGETSID